MPSGIHVVLLVLISSYVLVTEMDAVTYKEFRKAALNFNPGMLQPQCKIAFQKCTPKLLGLMALMENVRKRWDEYESVPCVKESLERGFPDLSQECTVNGPYGEAMRCHLTEQVINIYGDRQKLVPAMECLLQYGKP